MQFSFHEKEQINTQKETNPSELFVLEGDNITDSDIDIHSTEESQKESDSVEMENKDPENIKINNLKKSDNSSQLSHEKDIQQEKHDISFNKKGSSSYQISQNDLTCSLSNVNINEEYVETSNFGNYLSDKDQNESKLEISFFQIDQLNEIVKKKKYLFIFKLFFIFIF